MAKGKTAPAARETPRQMGYECLDCGYRSAKGFPQGCCPGCGSFRIRRLAPGPEPEPSPARRSYRLALLVALWIYLVWKIHDVWVSLG